jgi:hypothetical protein
VLSLVFFISAAGCQFEPFLPFEVTVRVYDTFPENGIQGVMAIISIPLTGMEIRGVTDKNGVWQSRVPTHSEEHPRLEHTVTVIIQTEPPEKPLIAMQKFETMENLKSRSGDKSSRVKGFDISFVKQGNVITPVTTEKIE